MANGQIPESASAESVAPIKRLPALRLHHLFALTTVMAILFGISGPMQNEAGPDRDLRTAIIGFTFLHHLLSAIAITITGYGIAWRRRGLQFFDQPGHWLLVQIAIATVIGLIPWFVLRTIHGFATNADIAYSFVWMTLLPGFINLVINIYIGRKKCDTRRWTWVFYAKAFAAIAVAWGEIIILIALGLAVGADRERRPASEQIHRDALHWCGVIVQLCMSLLMLLLIAFFLFAFALGWFAP